MIEKKIETVIWFHTAFLGDLVLSTAAINCLRKARPEIRQIMVTSPLGAKILGKHPNIDRVVVVDKKKDNLISSILKLRQELVHEKAGESCVLLQVHTSYRSSLITRCLGIPVVSYREAGFSFLASKRCNRVSALHESARVGLLLEVIGIPREQILAARPSLPALALPHQLQSSLDKLSRPIVAIAPGSVWATKKWPIESYCELAKRIVAAGFAVIVLGSDKEKADGDAIENSLMGEKSVINLCGKTSLDDLCGLYPQIDYLIANDSSPIHFASAYNIPTVAIFGATVQSMGFGPLSEGSVVASIDMSCRPCSDHGPKVCPLKHFDCMKKLSVEHVFKLLDTCVTQAK